MRVCACVFVNVHANKYIHVYVFVFQNPKEVVLSWEMKVCRIKMKKLKYS